jgi:hypothetical protein
MSAVWNWRANRDEPAGRVLTAAFSGVFFGVPGFIFLLLSNASFAFDNEIFTKNGRNHCKSRFHHLFCRSKQPNPRFLCENQT